MQILLLRNGIDLSRFVLVGREFTGESRIFYRSRMVWPVDNVLSVENVFCRDNLIGECRGPKITVTIAIAMKIFKKKFLFSKAQK